ncbi:MAG: hypothetical protein WCH10_02755 [bacterium]
MKNLTDNEINIVSGGITCDDISNLCEDTATTAAANLYSDALASVNTLNLYNDVPKT